MSPDLAVDVLRRAVEAAVVLAAPALILGTVVGLVVGLLQAATQVHEMTLTLVPKMAAVVAALALFGPWMVRFMVHFTTSLIADIPLYLR